MVLTVALFLIDLFSVVHSYNGIVHNSYNEWSRTTSTNMDESPKGKVEWTQKVTKGYMQYDPMYVKFYNTE